MAMLLRTNKAVIYIDDPQMPHINRWFFTLTSIVRVFVPQCKSSNGTWSWNAQSDFPFPVRGFSISSSFVCMPVSFEPVFYIEIELISKFNWENVYIALAVV